MKPRFESFITVPAGWTALVNDGGGNDSVTWPAATYTSHDAALAALKGAADTATGRVHTFTRSKGGSGTGILTWAISVASSVTFSSTDMRDCLGYTGNLGSASSHVAPRPMRGCWIPDADIFGDDIDLDSKGHLRGDATYVRSPTGELFVWTGNSFVSYRSVLFEMVVRTRALDGVDAAVMSFQQWVRESQWGGAPGFPIDSAHQAPKVKVFINADTDAPLGATAGGDGIYRLVLRPDLGLSRPDPGYTGWYTVELAELVKVP